MVVRSAIRGISGTAEIKVLKGHRRSRGGNDVGRSVGRGVYRRSVPRRIAPAIVVGLRTNRSVNRRIPEPERLSAHHYEGPASAVGSHFAIGKIGRGSSRTVRVDPVNAVPGISHIGFRGRWITVGLAVCRDRIVRPLSADDIVSDDSNRRTIASGVSVLTFETAFRR